MNTFTSTCTQAKRQDQRHPGADEWRQAPVAPARAASIIPEPCVQELAAEPRTERSRHASRGFTLIELMIAVAVAAVLTGVALPSFESQLQRARRADVLVSMMLVQAAQERFRSNGTSYGALADIGVATASPAGHYSLQTTAATPDGYDVLATAIGAQARDANCRHMKLSAAGGNLAYASGADVSVANSAAANRSCWNL